jgi:hypothetical protein
MQFYGDINIHRTAERRLVLGVGSLKLADYAIFGENSSLVQHRIACRAAGAALSVFLRFAASARWASALRRRTGVWDEETAC